MMLMEKGVGVAGRRDGFKVKCINPPLLPATPLSSPLHHFIIFLICFYIEKLRKQIQFEKVLWNKKNEISRI